MQESGPDDQDFHLCLVSASDGELQPMGLALWQTTAAPTGDPDRRSPPTVRTTTTVPAPRVRPDRPLLAHERASEAEEVRPGAKEVRETAQKAAERARLEAEVDRLRAQLADLGEVEVR